MKQNENPYEMRCRHERERRDLLFDCHEAILAIAAALDTAIAVLERIDTMRERQSEEENNAQ
jgi:hypothetical protein